MLWELPLGLGPGLSSKTQANTVLDQGCPVRHRESTLSLYLSPEPRVAPTKVWAKGVSSSEMNVTWEPVNQDMNGILLGYEVSINLGWGEEGGLGLHG
jgi:hypothetical protein